MTAPIRPEPPNLENVLAKQANAAIAQGADPREVGRLLTKMVMHLRANPDISRQGSEAIAQGADPAAVGGELLKMVGTEGDAFTGTGAGRTFGDEGSFAQSALSGVPFGEKTKAVLDAAIGAKPYAQGLSDQRLADKAYAYSHRGKAIAATLAGAALPAIATLGASVPEEGALLAPKVPLLARIAKGAAAGAGLGGLQGASDATGSVQDYKDKITHGAGVGGLVGSVAPVVGAAAVGAARKVGLPDLVSGASQFLSDKLGIPGAARLAAATGSRGEASRLVGQRLAADNAAGVVPQDHAGIPMLALDRGGPNVEKLAQGIVHGPPGPGSARLSASLTGRLQNMKGSVQSAITDATGVAPGEGIAPLRQLIKDQSAEANRLYAAARTATQGQPVQSPTLNAILETPAGKQAYAWAQLVKADNMSPLPKIGQVNEDAPMMLQLTQLGVPREKILAILRGQIDVPKEVPDPETLHLMKQKLSKMARLGDEGQLEGDLATQAHAAKSVWKLIRQELPPIWQKADEAYAGKARLIDQMNEGRNVFRTPINPAGRAKVAAATGLNAVKERAANASPEGQDAFRTGTGMAAQTLAGRLGEGARRIKSPGSLFANGDERVAQTQAMFARPEDEQAFHSLVKAWDDAQAQKERIMGNSATGGRVAEQAARQPDKATAGFFRELARLNPGNALRSLGAEASSEGDRATRQKVDAAIAEILTKPNRNALDEATLTALMRHRLGTVGEKALPRLAASDATSQQ